MIWQETGEFSGQRTHFPKAEKEKLIEEYNWDSLNICPLKKVMNLLLATNYLCYSHTTNLSYKSINQWVSWRPLVRTSKPQIVMFVWLLSISARPLNFATNDLLNSTTSKHNDEGKRFCEKLDVQIQHLFLLPAEIQGLTRPCESWAGGLGLPIPECLSGGEFNWKGQLRNTQTGLTALRKGLTNDTNRAQQSESNQSFEKGLQRRRTWKRLNADLLFIY